jgi:hypothetical protein
LIGQSKFTNLYIELSRNGERKNEKLKISIEEPTLIKKIIDVYTESLECNEDEMTYELGLDKKDFKNWYGLYEKPLLTFTKNPNK